MMYTYNRATGRHPLRRPCEPTGLPPSNSCQGEPGRRFMTDDGRVFFATRDALVPERHERRHDRRLRVRQRPAAADHLRHRRAGTHRGGLPVPGDPAPASRASAATASTSTSRPSRRSSPKTSTAASSSSTTPAQAAASDPHRAAALQAADECHGETSAPPAAPRIGTRNDLGAGGNIPAPAKKKKAKKKKKRAQKAGPEKAGQGQEERQGRAEEPWLSADSARRRSK